MRKRNYSMLGPDAERAVESGLASADWYHTEIPRKEMKSLMKREDQLAIRDTFVLFGAMVLFAGFGIAIWPSLWSAPFWLAYGVLYGSAMDSRWHEVRAWNAISNRVDEQCSLSDRILLYDPEPGRMAMEPRT